LERVPEKSGGPTTHLDYRRGITAVTIIAVITGVVAASRSETPVATFLAVIAAVLVGTLIAVATRRFVL
jgi:hypothetical protein